MLDLLVVPSTCQHMKKVALYVDACQDRQMSEYPDFKRTTTFVAKSMRRFSG